SEEVIDLTRPALSAESQRQEPPTPAALPDRTVIEIPETPTPAKPPAGRKSSRILAKRESGDRPRRSAEPRQANEPLIPAQPTNPQPKSNFNQPDLLYPTLPEPSFSPPSPPEREAVARPAPGLGRANVARQH
ncbi:MAG TPA: hypothetical protein VFN97_08745, partial [Actinospica sp.]|nr:hypothetical protein [Actinospica sp.]